jgi:hypothetical protein
MQTASDLVLFEPATAGGGSLWSGDDLLGTLSVSPLAQRRGRLSLRHDERAGDVIRSVNGQCYRYHLYEAARLVGQAERALEARSLWLRYCGTEYLATRESLLNIQKHSALITLPPLLTWNTRSFALQVQRQTDVMLVGFYVYIAYDLMEGARMTPQCYNQTP